MRPPVPAESLSGGRRTRGLRAAALTAVVILAIEYGFGVWVNLYARLSAADRGAGLFAGIRRAFADGPPGLSIHAVIGVVLLATASSVLVRALLARRPILSAVAATGLCAIVVAALSGARFVGHSTNSASLAMALAGGVAIVCYASILFAASAATRDPQLVPPPTADPIRTDTTPAGKPNVKSSD